MTQRNSLTKFQALPFNRPRLKMDLKKLATKQVQFTHCHLKNIDHNKNGALGRVKI